MKKMNHNSEKEILKKLQAEAEESITFFSNQNKQERERAVCAAFLRCIGVNFNREDILPGKEEPIDIEFQGARFQIKELMDPGRKRHDEYKKALEKYKNSESLSELIEQFSPMFAQIQKICYCLVGFLKPYASKLGKELCAQVDILVYVNLQEYFSKDEDNVIDYSGLVQQNWRSVSMVSGDFCYIFYASETSPVFLKRFQKQIRKEFTGSDLFEI